MAVMDTAKAYGTEAANRANELFERYLAGRIGTAQATVEGVLAQQPSATPEQVADQVAKRRLMITATVGGAVGGVMLAPGGSGVGRLLMTAGDIVVSAISAVDLILETAIAHGHVPGDAAEARAWITDVMTLPNDDLVHHVSASTALPPEERAAALGSIPMPAALGMKGFLPVRLVLMALPEAEDDTAFLSWRSLVPVGIGAAGGAYVDFAATKRIAARAQRYFGPIDDKEREAMAQRVGDLERVMQAG